MPTLTQIGYAVAVDRERNFRRAAKTCAVTQPTLSMQLQKLEQTLDVVLFDRSRKPVVPTQEGVVLLAQFREVLRAHAGIAELVEEMRGRVSGPYRLGIIPTMAATVLPRIVPTFLAQYPDVELTVEELTTPEIIRRLGDETLDGGILATPLDAPSLVEFPLCREDFVVFHAPDVRLALDEAGRVQVGQLPTEQLIVMREGHCLRTQTLDLCALGEVASQAQRLHFEAGSVATLCAMVRGGAYFTVLPALAAGELAEQGHGSLIKEIAGPVPYREVALVVRRLESRRAVREALWSLAHAALAGCEGTRPRRDAPIRPL